MDQDDTYSATVEVLLEDHLQGVSRWAERFSGAVGLSPNVGHDIVLAGSPAWAGIDSAPAPRYATWTRLFPAWAGIDPSLRPMCGLWP